MSTPIEMTSNKPYIVGAFYDWISDNDLTPYIVVDVSVYGVMVPMSFVNDGQIVLNISSSAVGSIVMGEAAIEFSARFGGKLEHLVVPYGAIGAIYAKENGAGTSLPIEHPEVVEEDDVPAKPALAGVESKPVASTGEGKEATGTKATADKTSEDKPAKGRPSLKVVK
ncbi:ClpXP protease specificity-enhancing factor [Thalassotalea euphylliae]|uniref:ClpXP protease specificity-enhancing factor n=1 Tax=Thalassotalea euphylliae TaxID=1655234 RepID=A0A3E0U578_9GAMM|nr:ClpXP protease specificity-enhancing factor [Thalassotalea euphylliae]REL31890.1 ClpXP protease specificity-enhancing factor [Thalassotalea euphylliae]